MTNGTIFTTDFLAEGIKDTDYWRSITTEELDQFRNKLSDIYNSFPIDGNPNESTTERDLIDPIIEALGWSDYLTQQTAAKKGRSDVPDYLLFECIEQKEKANSESKDAARYKYGLSILEAKAWQIPLDRKSNDALGRGVPSNQILRYLNAVDIQSNGAIKWGILTNGREWRLYYQDAKSRSEEFLSLDLPVILGLPGFTANLFSHESALRQDWLKIFYAIFRKAAFIPTVPDNVSFHKLAIREGQYWETKVAEDLSDIVFKTVLPGLAQGLTDSDPDRPKTLDAEYLSEVRESTLILLYRMLFLLYAEDRNLLPVSDTKYDDYGLRMKVREDILKRIDDNDIFSERRADYYRLLTGLCKSVDEGDDSIGLPPYNGGLFDESRAPLLNRAEIPDSTFAPLFDRLSRHYQGDKKSWINYRDLTVQQLGSIYERFLEYELITDDKGAIAARPNIFSRKTSGSYYTPDSLVNLIIEKAVGPLIDEKENAFKAKAGELKSKRGAKAERLKELIKLDPAENILQLRICDPAMGSGHFLVSLVDYLADRLLILIEEAESHVEWVDDNSTYTSPLSKSIDNIRSHIKDEARKHKWIIAEGQLDDRHIVRRMILKRCVYGVDKNPMAVELAKVSLWLHTFTVGAPLSFLDHHLRCGDSLFGEFTRGVEEQLRARGSMFISGAVAKAKATAQGMAKIEALTDADIAEVKESANVFNEVSKGSLPLTRFFDLIHGLRWIDMKKDTEKKAAVNEFLDQKYGDPVRIAATGELAAHTREFPAQQSLLEEVEPQTSMLQFESKGSQVRKTFETILKEALTIAKEENFLHWEVAFPMVWDKWENNEPDGGFDAIIGNPPWDRMKLQEVEWFSARVPEIAFCSRASDRKNLIGKLKDQDDPISASYDKASDRATSSTSVARDNGHYPLLSVGDINLYSLFVERAHRLVKKKGCVGLLVPSGIASDKGASNFFKSIATTSRLGHLYDFENKKVFFPDVHASFKFCVYIAGGEERQFNQSQMAFFLHNVDELNDPDKVFALTAEDFKRVNPNTGTAPIFRTQRDAQITRRIYEQFPILHKEGEEPVWPVKYYTMFHMTNDSHLFKTREELEKDGFYPVAGNRLKRGEEECVPLYEGKMVQAFDHRAANVVVNLENLNRPAQPEATTLEQHSNSKWYPNSQFWVSTSELPGKYPFHWFLGFKDVTAPTNMRSMIAAVIPLAGVGNTYPVLLPITGQNELFKSMAALMLATLDSLAFDFVARQKIQGQHLNWFIVEQLPVIPPENSDEPIGKTTVGDLVRDHVLRLTYTAHDMAPFARDMGYDGEPFIWDEEERRHLRARLDALFFILYNIDRDDAAYILDTFPIVKKNDEKEFGQYLTKELILAYMNALNAGDTESRISV